MKALTVRQPWAWAIVAGVKQVENRSQGAAGWRHRGPLLIHAAQTLSLRGLTDPRVLIADGRGSLVDVDYPRGQIIGSVELVDIHPSSGCCEPWGEDTYPPANAEARPPGRVTHLVLEDAAPTTTRCPRCWGAGYLGEPWRNPCHVCEGEGSCAPIDARGALGLWTWSADL